jgi:hypothetical protein
MIADPPIAVGWPCDVNAHRKLAWSSKPAAVAKEPITAGCWLPRRRRSGSPLECHRVSRCAACRVLITGRAATTAGRLDRVLCSESSMAPIKPPEDRFGNSAPSRWSRKCLAWDDQLRSAPELSESLVAGHSLHSIARDFAARGVRTGSGLVSSPQHLRALALSPTYTTLRAHQPGVGPRSLSAERHKRVRPARCTRDSGHRWSRARWLARPTERISRGCIEH